MPEPKYPIPTWAREGVTPTVDDLRRWLRDHDPAEHDARVAAGMILGMLAAEERDHAREREDHERTRALYAAEQAAVARYRAAWLSARERARGAYYDGHCDGMLEA